MEANLFKIIFTFFLIIFSLPVFANNSLQNEYEKDFSLQNSMTLSLINNDFQAYYNGGGSMYGYLLYAKDEYREKNKALDVLYITKIIDSWKQAYNNQSEKYLNYIRIDDKDFCKLEADTKRFISIYNSMIPKK